VGYENTCTNCGTKFSVKQKCMTDPNNKRKFKRCCSKECSNALKSKNMKSLHAEGKLTRERPAIVTELDRDILIRLYCFEHKLLSEISKSLKVKSQTLSREMSRLDIPKEFYRECPQCKETFSCKNRSMVNPKSNKFKKFCSRGCFLSSRNQSDTWIERATEQKLKDLSLEYVKQYEVGRMTLDFYLPDFNLAIEVNGDFWHCNPDIYGKTKPIHKYHERILAKDKRKLKQLDDLGYEVLIIWENDIATDECEAFKPLEEIAS
jgi:G:T-mismatch repair DNA endonuclease (very short patch repair protein)